MPRTTTAQLNEKIAALEARLTVAKTVYRDQKSRIAELEAQLAARGAAKVVPPAAPRVWEWLRADGTLMVSTKVGNKTVSKPAEYAHAC